MAAANFDSKLELLRNNDPSLTRLIIFDYSILGQPDKLIEFAKILKDNISLIRLDIYRDISPDAMKSLSEALMILYVSRTKTFDVESHQKCSKTSLYPDDE